MYTFISPAQTTNCIRELNVEGGAILFPEVENIEGSEEINEYLLNYLKKAFYIKNDKTLKLSLEESRFKGLDSLTYLALETDSTLSFALTFKLKRADMLSGWVDFFTFDKQTGKKLQLYDIFPNIEICKVANTMLSLIHHQIYVLDHKVYRLFDEKKINIEDYSYLEFNINKVLLAAINFKHDFMLSKNHLYLKNGILFPQNINSSIPVFFIIDANEFRIRAESYECL
ncbi:MAG: hypothetical protein PHT26_16050 [Lentimicrobiaceae bacterium]|nr:hypothetical protein [Lentimicrobiaceae bacterium]